MAEVYFFGCIGHPGHRLWKPSGRPGVNGQPVRDYDIPDWPWRWGELDAKYAPTEPYRDELGLARVVHHEGWTVLAMWDRSVDSRRNSNAAFIARGEHSFAGMAALASEHFYAVWERINAQAEVRELAGRGRQMTGSPAGQVRLPAPSDSEVSDG